MSKLTRVLGECNCILSVAEARIHCNFVVNFTSIVTETIKLASSLMIGHVR